MYDRAALEAALGGTLAGGRLHLSPVTGSTSDDALEAARRGAPHGAVFLADEQTAGRGRGDHGWESAPGQGLYLSIVLRLPLPPSRLALLPLAAGLAAAEAIRSRAALTPDLRWPNDLLIGPRKAGGILVESKTEGDRLVYAVAGIGINVHQSRFGGRLEATATSLDLEAGRRIDRQPLVVALVGALEREAAGLLDPERRDRIPARVAASSTWARGRPVEVHGPHACTGITAGLDPDGFLLVETAGGTVTVRSGGVRARETDPGR